jgi:hypothetical protein
VAVVATAVVGLDVATVVPVTTVDETTVVYAKV